TINIGESTRLDVTGIGDFEWLPNDNLSGATSSNPLVSPLEDATFYVMTTDAYGCQSMDSVRITVERNFDIVMPNAFSPNRDGNNDVFAIGALRGISEILDFKIFTRWGQEVFSTNDVTEGWDGDYDFRPMGIGTYAYQIRVLNVIGEEMVWSGNFTLIR
ncbi:MAG: gliding motility-associated C-terminal domain-containing protein, partial [Chitinophagales bacterium]